MQSRRNFEVLALFFRFLINGHFFSSWKTIDSSSFFENLEEKYIYLKNETWSLGQPENISLSYIKSSKTVIVPRFVIIKHEQENRRTFLLFNKMFYECGSEKYSSIKCIYMLFRQANSFWEIQQSFTIVVNFAREFLQSWCVWFLNTL